MRKRRGPRRNCWHTNLSIQCRLCTAQRACCGNGLSVRGSECVSFTSLLCFPTDTNAALSSDVSKKIVSCRSCRNLFAGSESSPKIKQGFDSKKRLIRRHIARKSGGIVQKFLSFLESICDVSIGHKMYHEQITYNHQKRMRGRRDFPRARR